MPRSTLPILTGHARAARGRDDPPPPRAAARGAARSTRSRSSTRAGAARSRRQELAAALEGRTLERLSRRGKYLVWEFEDDAYLLVHLRMTGNLLLDPHGAPPYTRVWLRFDGHDLAFADQRRFGTGELALGPEQLDAFFAARLGVEPLGGRVHGRPPARARAHVARADQGVPARPEADRRRREHLRRRGAVPGPHPPAAAGEPAHAPRRRRRSRDGDRRVAERRDRRQGRDDRRLPRPVRQQRRVPGRVPRSTCARASRASTAAGPCASCVAAGRGTYVCERCQPRPRRYAAASASATRRPARSA